MKDVQHIHQTIIQLSRAYETLNKQWKDDGLSINEFQLLRQEDYHHFYEEYKCFNVEELILLMIAHSVDKTVLNRLRVLLELNIQIYQNRKKAFGKLNKQELFVISQKNKFDEPLAVLYKDKADILLTEYSSPKEKESLLNECERSINRLEKEKTGYIHEASWIWRNYYDEIHSLSESFLAIIESYFFKEKAAHSSGSTVYFDMRLLSMIYTECNKEQFEDIAEIDFYSILNGQRTAHPLKIKDKEKIRTCYLIHKLHELLGEGKKENWLHYILPILGISEKLYFSKYKEATSPYAGRKSIGFAKKIDQIFEQ